MKKTLIVLMLVLLSAVLMVSCNVSLEVHTVTFDTQGGSVVDPVEVKEWRKVTKPADPTREGFNFVKWTTDEAGETEYDFDSFVRDNITLYAQWTDKVCKVTFNSMEGSAVDPVDVKYGEKIAKPTDPTKEGYKFSKWTTDEAGEEVYNFDSAVKEDITLYAQWLKVYTVTFDSNGGDTTVAPVKVNEGEKVAKPTDPTKAGYDLLKWTTDKEGTEEYNFESAVKENITLYAQWRVCYKVGDTGPAGGIIFYVNPKASTDGWKYLEAAPNVEMTASFGNADVLVGTETGIGRGKSNTEKLVAKSSDFGAAKDCDNYSVTKEGKTYDDWFLPSKDELAEIYKNKDKITNLKNSSYLSSSEDGADKAWRQNFSSGEQASYSRSTQYYVCPVRSF